MKIIKRVNIIEVKRCFAISQFIRWSQGKKSYLSIISEREFKVQLKSARLKILNLSEKELDKIVRGKYKKRLIAYNNSDWYLGEFNTDEAGVWKRAGDLPLEWTRDSLKHTADRIRIALKEDSKLLKNRARHAISNILKTNISYIQKEKYLLPIAFIGGTGTRGRKRLKIKTTLDIDDGCMRSISLAVSGKDKIKAYIGFPKK